MISPSRSGAVSSALNPILAELCSALQLSPTQYRDAAQKYQAVGEWLSSCPTLRPLRPQVYPQGSAAIGTTVKPREQDEFDVDLVIELATSEPDPGKLYEMVGWRQMRRTVRWSNGRTGVSG